MKKRSNYTNRKKAFNILAVVTTGMFAGCTLMVGVTFGQIWTAMSPDAFLEHLPQQFIFVLMTVLPVMVLQIIALIMSLRHDWHVPELKKLWLLSFGAFMLNGTITGIYHLPQVIWISTGEYEALEAVSVLQTWLLLHIPRVFLGLVAAYYAVKATLRSSQYHQQNKEMTK